MNRLLAIDFSNLVHRARYGWPEAYASHGRQIHAGTGFGAMALSLLARHGASHVVCAMDTPRASLARRRIDPDYKQPKVPLDEDEVQLIREAFRSAREVADALGMPQVSAPGAEADDVIATYARTFPGEVIIATSDRDLMGCLDPGGRVRVHLMGDERVVDFDTARDVIPVAPNRLAEFKALAGDPSDGYGGVPGIGPKRAHMVVESFPDLESAIAQAHRLPGIIGEALAAHPDAARRCRELARLDDALDLPPVAAWQMPDDAPRALMAIEQQDLGGDVHYPAHPRVIAIPPAAALSR